MPWATADSDPRYGTSAWKRARAHCLRAANWRCQLRLDGCAGAAREADHVVSPRDGGAFTDPANLRAVCTPCHRKRTAQQGRGYRAGSGGDPPVQQRTQW